MKQADYHEHEEISGDHIFEADVVKIAFCPECGNTVIVLGDYDKDVAVAHLSTPVLDNIIQDLQSIRYRMKN